MVDGVGLVDADTRKIRALAGERGPVVEENSKTGGSESIIPDSTTKQGSPIEVEEYNIDDSSRHNTESDSIYVIYRIITSRGVEAGRKIKVAKTDTADKKTKHIPNSKITDAWDEPTK